MNSWVSAYRLQLTFVIIFMLRREESTTLSPKAKSNGPRNIYKVSTKVNGNNWVIGASTANHNVNKWSQFHCAFKNSVPITFTVGKNTTYKDKLLSQQSFTQKTFTVDSDDMAKEEVADD